MLQYHQAQVLDLFPTQASSFGDLIQSNSFKNHLYASDSQIYTFSLNLTFNSQIIFPAVYLTSPLGNLILTWHLTYPNQNFLFSPLTAIPLIFLILASSLDIHSGAQGKNTGFTFYFLSFPHTHIQIMNNFCQYYHFPLLINSNLAQVFHTTCLNYFTSFITHFLILMFIPCLLFPLCYQIDNFKM